MQQSLVLPLQLSLVPLPLQLPLAPLLLQPPLEPLPSCQPEQPSLLQLLLQRLPLMLSSLLWFSLNLPSFSPFLDAHASQNHCQTLFKESLSRFYVLFKCFFNFCKYCTFFLFFLKKIINYHNKSYFIFDLKIREQIYPKISAAETPAAQAVKPPWNNPINPS